MTPADIPELIQHLFRTLKERHGLPDLRMDSAITSWLCGYRWPGNIRELENVIERLVVLSSGDQINVSDLPDEIRRRPVTQNSFLAELPEEGISLDAIERELLIRALDKFHGNQTQAARYLDISRRTLIYRMEKHGIRREGETE